MYSIGPDTYLEHLRKVKQAVHIPVIGSLNGVSTGGWIDYARKIEQAGADALELNMYYLATDPELTSAELEETYITLVSDVCSQVQHPAGSQAQPILLLPCRTSPGDWPRPAQTAWCCSTAFTSPISTWKSWKSSPTWC